MLLEFRSNSTQMILGQYDDHPDLSIIDDNLVEEE